MVNIYRIRLDVNNYQALYVDDDKWHGDVLSLFTFDGMPRISNWAAPPVFILDPKLKRGNFLSFQLMGGGAFIADAKAVSATQEFFEMAGEMLPLPYEDEMFQVINITECINVLDQKGTKWHVHEKSGTKIYIESYAFHPRRFTESSLFKIPETCKTHIYTLERCGDPECEFKARVEQAGLTGLIFEKVWSDEGEPITVGP